MSEIKPIALDPDGTPLNSGKRLALACRDDPARVAIGIEIHFLVGIEKADA